MKFISSGIRSPAEIFQIECLHPTSKVFDFIFRFPTEEKFKSLFRKSSNLKTFFYSIFSRCFREKIIFIAKKREQFDGEHDLNELLMWLQFLMIIITVWAH